MALWSFSLSSRKARALPMAVALACGLALVMPEAANAGSGEPASSMLRSKKKAVSDTSGASKQNWGHASTGSGGKATTVTRIVNDGSVSPFLAPDSSAAMQALADRYAAIVAAGGWPKVPSGKLQKGSTNKAVDALNKRLHAEGYLRVEATQGEFAEVYTSATEDAVKRFQANHGLAVTGTVDGPTLSRLNVPAERRLATIRANLPRAAEYSKDLGSRYVVVNIPAMQIETVSNGKVYSIHNAIVGRPSRPTPVVMTPLTTIRFNPYWNAPASIVEKDIVPRMMSSGPSRIMNEMNMKIFKGVGGPEVDPNSINWRRVVVDDYHFRQEPGGSNAMATAKIEFNSPFGIYLHDTPEPHLFETGSRFYSSGCVRVQNVATLINWILQGQDGIDSSRIAALAESKERLDTTIADAPQLRVAYLTAWAAGDGVAAFRDDIYELDGAGFVLGQPLPVGETKGGQRFVLKPIPRDLEAVDADEAFGFASLFRPRNPDKVDATAMVRTRAADDSLIATKSKSSTKVTAKTAATKSKFAKSTARGVRNGNSDKESGLLFFASKQEGTKKPLKKLGAKKKTDSSKTAKSAAKDKTKVAAKDKAEDTKTAKTKTVKKVKKTDEVEVAAKKPDAAAEAKSATAKKTATTAKKPECKPGADGKLPAGCKAPPATAKKPPAAKPDKVAAVKKPAKTETAAAAN